MAEGIQTHIIDASKRMQDVMGGDAPGSSVSGQSKGKTEKNLAQQLKKLAGIDLGLGALLKQSQIFTGYMGNLFAIVGAIIDTVLAPLAPLAFKALAALGKKIPAIAKMAEEWVPRIVERTKKIIVGIDTFLKKWTSLNWAGHVAKAIGLLIAINLGIKFLRMSGSLAYGLTGARGGVGLARGAVGAVSRLTGRGGQAAAASQAARAATPMVAGAGGMGGFARRLLPFGGGGGGGEAVRAAKQASYGQDLYASAARKAAAPTGVMGKVASRVGMRSIAGTLGKGLGRGIPIVGAITSGIYGYAEGRNRGMSKGQSAMRGGASIGGAVVGGALGSFLGPVGTIIGAGAGAWAGGKLFDMMFGDKGGGRGDASNLGVGGGVGLSGYSVPTFIAMSAEAMSKPVLELKFVIDEGAIAMANLKDATNGVITGFGAFSAGLLELIGLTGGFDQPDDPEAPGGLAGTGGAGILAGPEGGVAEGYGLFKDTDIAAAALEVERVEEAEVLRKKGYMDLPDTFEGTGGASTAVGQGYFRDFSLRNQKETEAIIKEDEKQSKDTHNAYLAQKAAERQAEKDRIAQVKADNERMIQFDLDETARIEASVRKAAQEKAMAEQARIDEQFVANRALQESSGGLGSGWTDGQATKEIVAAIQATGGINQNASFTGDEGGTAVGQGFFRPTTVQVTTDQPPAVAVGNSWASVVYAGDGENQIW